MIQELLSRGISPLLIPLPARLSVWAEQKFVMVKGEKKIGDWRNLPYQIAILNWLGNDDIKIITFRKAARTGATKMLCINWSYKTEHLKRDTLLYQPTVEDAKKFKADEIDGLLVHIESLRSCCRTNPDKRSSDNTVDRINFSGATTDILGGKTPRNFRRMSKDEVNYDELSGFDQDIGGEGSATTLGDTRFETSSFPKSVRVSTPKIKNTCQISKSLASADVVMCRWLPCPDCGDFQILKWRGNNGEYLFDLESGKYTCVHCGSMIGYDRYADMDRLGQWRSEDGSVVYDEDLDLFFRYGEPISPPRHVGIDKLWSAYSYFLGWEALTDYFREAVNEMKRTGDFTLLKSFINTKLGEVWEDRGERVEREIYREDRLDSVDANISNDIVFITGFVDVQGGKDARLEYEVVGWGVGEESWSLEYGIIPGDIEHKQVWNALEEVRKQRWTRVDGINLGISRMGVDSGYLPDEVYRYTTPRQPHVVATKGHAKDGMPIISSFTYPKKDKKTMLYMIGVDTAKIILFNRLNKIIESGPGFCHFPIGREKKYFDQLTNSEEKVEVRDKKTGHKHFIFRKISGRRNEALDCRVGNMAMLRVKNPKLEVRKAKLDELAEQIRLKLPVSASGNNMRPGRRVRSAGIQ